MTDAKEIREAPVYVLKRHFIIKLFHTASLEHATDGTRAVSRKENADKLWIWNVFA